MAELLADRWPEQFARHVFKQLPAPLGPDRVDPETGEFVAGKKLWEHGLRLSPEQEAPMFCPARFVLDAGGIRSGKSLRPALKILLDFLWRVQVRGVVDDIWGVVADTYSMAEEEMNHLHRLLGELGIPHEFRNPQNSSWTITFPDVPAHVKTLTAADVTKIASKPYRGLVLAEANQASYDAFTAARGRVSQTRGWIYLSGTFESQTKGPWYAQLWEDWQKEGAMGVSFSTPTWANRVVYPDGREEAEIKAAELDLPPDTFLEKYGGRPIKRSDLVMKYADERMHIAHRFPTLGRSYDPEKPVYLFSDPGTAHAYAVIAVQFWASDKNGDLVTPTRSTTGNVCWAIDAVYRWGREVSSIVAECAAKPWSMNAEVAIMDVAARQRRAEGAPVVEQWANLWREHTGQHIWIQTQPVPLAAGYDIHRRALLNSWPEDAAQRHFNADKKLRQVTDPEGPRLMFSPEAAVPLFGGLVDGQRHAGEYNLHRNRKAPDGTIMSDDPIDRDNDAIKALNYGLFWYFGPAGMQAQNIGTGTVPFEMSMA